MGAGKLRGGLGVDEADRALAIEQECRPGQRVDDRPHGLIGLDWHRLRLIGVLIGNRSLPAGNADRRDYREHDKRRIDQGDRPKRRCQSQACGSNGERQPEPAQSVETNRLGAIRSGVIRRCPPAGCAGLRARLVVMF